MIWVKEIGAKGGSDSGWTDDFPLNHELPAQIEIDCSRLRLPIQPMFAVRARVFIDWHTEHEREVRITAPSNPEARRLFEAMGIDPGKALVQEDDAIVPVTKLAEFDDVESVAARTQEIIEYQLEDVSPLGQATFMAVSELCGNAIDHGRNDLGAYAAVMRFSEPRRKVSTRSAISASASPSTFASAIRSGATMAGRLRMQPMSGSPARMTPTAASDSPRSSKPP